MVYWGYIGIMEKKMETITWYIGAYRRSLPKASLLVPPNYGLGFRVDTEKSCMTLSTLYTLEIMAL